MSVCVSKKCHLRTGQVFTPLIDSRTGSPSATSLPIFKFWFTYGADLWQKFLQITLCHSLAALNFEAIWGIWTPPQQRLIASSNPIQLKNENKRLIYTLRLDFMFIFSILINSQLEYVVCWWNIARPRLCLSAISVSPPRPTLLCRWFCFSFYALERMAMIEMSLH